MRQRASIVGHIYSEKLKMLRKSLSNGRSNYRILGGAGGLKPPAFPSGGGTEGWRTKWSHEFSQTSMLHTRLIKFDTQNSLCYNRLRCERTHNTNTWGCSSLGRASQWHCEGKGFDPPHLHQINSRLIP